MLYLLWAVKASQRQDFTKHKLQNGGAQREYCTMTAMKGSKPQHASHSGACYFVSGFFEVMFNLFSYLNLGLLSLPMRGESQREKYNLMAEKSSNAKM